MSAINPDELGNIYVLAPPPEEDKPRPLVLLDKRPATTNQIEKDILEFVPTARYSLSSLNNITKFSVGEFTLFFIPENENPNGALQEIEDFLGSPVEFKEIESGPPGLILFLRAFVR